MSSALLPLMRTASSRRERERDTYPCTYRYRSDYSIRVVLHSSSGRPRSTMAAAVYILVAATVTCKFTARPVVFTGQNADPVPRERHCGGFFSEAASVVAPGLVGLSGSGGSALVRSQSTWSATPAPPGPRHPLDPPNCARGRAPKSGGAPGLPRPGPGPHPQKKVKGRNEDRC